MASWRDVVGGVGRLALAVAKEPQGAPVAQADALATARPTGASSGWYNEVSGWGTVEADATASARFAPVWVPPTMARTLHACDGIAAKIIDAPIDGALREGYGLALKGGGELPPDVVASLERLGRAPVRWPSGDETVGVLEAVRALRTTSAVVGGALLVVGFDDGLPLEAPVGPHRGIAWFQVYDATQVGVFLSKPPPLARPGERGDQTFMVGGQRIHPSRAVAAAGVAVPQELTPLPLPFGLSVYGRVLGDLRGFRSGRGSAGSLLHDLSVRVFKLGVASQDYQDEHGVAALRTVLGFQQLAASRWRALVIGDDEEVTSTSHSVAGVSDLLRASGSDLAAAADMPETILFGRSPAGLSATGESDLETWYGRLRSEQRRLHGPLLARLHAADLRGLRTRQGPLPALEVEWPPLWVLDAKEGAQVAQAQAQAVKLRADALASVFKTAQEAQAAGLLDKGGPQGIKAALDTLLGML